MPRSRDMSWAKPKRTIKCTWRSDATCVWTSTLAVRCISKAAVKQRGHRGARRRDRAARRRDRAARRRDRGCAGHLDCNIEIIATYASMQLYIQAVREHGYHASYVAQYVHISSMYTSSVGPRRDRRDHRRSGQRREPQMVVLATSIKTLWATLWDSGSEGMPFKLLSLRSSF
jgi:hypothetical protein